MITGDFKLESEKVPTFNNSGNEVRGTPLRVTVYVTLTVLPRLNASTVTGSSIVSVVSLMGLAGVVCEPPAAVPGAPV
ncbi:hypothetical protein CP335_27355, partial [Pseudomonas fluorescens]